MLNNGDQMPAPFSHAFLIALTALSVAKLIPTNINIVVTAAATVFAGCWRSVKPEPPADAMSTKDAMKFPLVGSAMLFSLFLAFKFLDKELVNLILSTYFVLLGTFGIIATIDPAINLLLPKSLSEEITFVIPHSITKLFFMKEPFEISLTPIQALLAIPSAAFCYWYWSTKHWIGNNILGLVFCLQGIENLSLGAVKNGVIVLSGLFFYDIFWVFFTPVMVEVAKSLNGPIKLLFPRPSLDGDASKQQQQFSMLGLGDIIIPGIFVAIVLRYEVAKIMNTSTSTSTGQQGSRRSTTTNKKSTTTSTTTKRPVLFYTCFVSYCIGLIATIVVMNVFKAAQPALLYIVPAVLGGTFIHAALIGQAKELFEWSETPEHEEEKKVDDGGRVTRQRAAAQEKKET